MPMMNDSEPSLFPNDLIVTIAVTVAAMMRSQSQRLCVDKEDKEDQRKMFRKYIRRKYHCLELGPMGTGNCHVIMGGKSGTDSI